MRLGLAIRGQLRQRMAAEAQVILEAPGRAVEATTAWVRFQLQNQVRQVFRRSRRVANSIRGKVYRDGPGDVTGYVFSRFGRREGGRRVSFFEPFLTGATIRPRRAKWLYFPVQRGLRARRVRQSVRMKKNLAFIQTRPGRAVLVRRTRRRTTLIAVLVRQARYRRRLNFGRVADQAQRRLPEQVLEELERNAPDVV